ncbi:hypothetical protein LUX33_19425 [Actinomadura madurae]|uniref:hypothetical protein n=1 Tax=Actinomadura madurae TaxID=1993 RepID=UPI0020D237EA|nr:hypothetical protein [Actinomadura madurae]MCP9950358.1 hypothetical protein [Actinomadura madurae]
MCCWRSSRTSATPTSWCGRANGTGPPAQALIFSARVMGKAVQGLDLIRFGDTGLVTGLTVMVRPLPAAMTLARVVGKRMEDVQDAGGVADAGGAGTAGETGGPSGTAQV